MMCYCALMHPSPKVALTSRQLDGTVHWNSSQHPSCFKQWFLIKCVQHWLTVPTLPNFAAETLRYFGDLGYCLIAVWEVALYKVTKVHVVAIQSVLPSMVITLQYNIAYWRSWFIEVFLCHLSNINHFFMWLCCCIFFIVLRMKT